MASTDKSPEPAGPLRRLGAMLYDTLLVIALLMLASFLFLPITGGESAIRQGGGIALVYRLLLLGVWAGFFLYFWTAKGRTLGMQVWRLRLKRADGGPCTLADAALRLAFATVPWLPSAIALGLGPMISVSQTYRTVALWLLILIPLDYFAAWFDPQRRSLHDWPLKTRIVKEK